MSQVFSFAEESCWDGEIFRTVRREIVFVVACHAIQRGVSIRQEFVADFGLWYDLEDVVLLEILQQEVPGVDWGWFVFHKKLDHSGINVINPDSGEIVGSIYPRGRERRRSQEKWSGENVVSIERGREIRLEREMEDERRASEDREASERPDEPASGDLGEKEDDDG